MKFINILTPLLIAAAVSSCVVTQEEFNANHTLLEGSPKIRAQWTAECIKQPRSTERLQALSDFTNVPKNQASTALCSRLYGAYASGRLTYEDVKSIPGTGPLTPNLIRILQGR